MPLPFVLRGGALEFIGAFFTGFFGKFVLLSGKRNKSYNFKLIYLTPINVFTESKECKHPRCSGNKYSGVAHTCVCITFTP